jgi:hypothetical protein
VPFGAQQVQQALLTAKVRAVATVAANRMLAILGEN